MEAAALTIIPKDFSLILSPQLFQSSSQLAACVESSRAIKATLNLCRELELQGKEPTGSSGLGIAVSHQKENSRGIKHKLQSVFIPWCFQRTEENGL